MDKPVSLSVTGYETRTAEKTSQPTIHFMRREKNALNIFLSVGSLEDTTWPVNPVKKFNKDLMERNIDAVDLQLRIYNHLDHMDVGTLSFTKDLQHVYRKWGIS